MPKDPIERLIPESQLKQWLADALVEVAVQLGADVHQNKRRFLPTAKAWQELGFENREQLYDAIAAGLFRLGQEVQDRRKPQAKLARYYFDIERCRMRLDQLPEKRRV